MEVLFSNVLKDLGSDRVVHVLHEPEKSEVSGVGIVEDYLRGVAQFELLLLYPLHSPQDVLYFVLHDVIENGVDREVSALGIFQDTVLVEFPQVHLERPELVVFHEVESEDVEDDSLKGRLFDHPLIVIHIGYFGLLLVGLQLLSVHNGIELLASNEAEVLHHDLHIVLLGRQVYVEGVLSIDFVPHPSSSHIYVLYSQVFAHLI